MEHDQMKYGRYEIIEELGQGSMGVVYKANDPQIDRIVALKVLRQDRMASDDFVQRFMKEARAIGRLSHPNIVTVNDVGQDNNSIYIAMEFLEGSALNKLIDAGLMENEQVVAIGIQVAEALHYASGKGIIHRDVKPTNIIINSEGLAKLTDFGIARIENPLDQQQTQIGEILGTPSYMSPEQVKGQPVDNRTDLFSLGIILYELCTGRRPFAGDTMMAIFREIMETEPADPVKVNPAVAKALSAVIMKSLRKNPAERFQTGKEMAQSLQECLAQESVSIPPPQAEPAVRSTKPPGLYFGLGIILLILCSGGLYLFFSQKDVKHRAPTEITTEDVKTPDKPAFPASLNIASTPPGARIYINGTYSGTTPLVKKLPLGKYEVRLSLQDYYDWEAQLQIDEEGEKQLAIELLAVNDIKP